MKNEIMLFFRTIIYACISVIYITIFYRIFEYLLDGKFLSGVGLTSVTLLFTGFFYSLVNNWKTK